MRSELEGKLLYSAPAEVLIAQPASAPTERLLAAFASPSNGMRRETAAAAKYSSGGALAAVAEFYGGAAAGGGADGGSSSSGGGAALDAALQLPPLVLRALAHALDHLRPFGLQAVLRQGASFRPFSAVAELSLSPNTLRQLEILRNSDDGGEKGSLLWLLDRTLTAPGARLMRHWVSRPLRDVAAINARLDAVEELLHRGEAG